MWWFPVLIGFFLGAAAAVVAIGLYTIIAADEANKKQARKGKM